MNQPWRGETVAVLCSGPSMTQADADACRGLRVIVTNSTWKLAPWADALFAYDSAWWRLHVAEVSKTFVGQRYCRYGIESQRYGCESLDGMSWSSQLGNSGAAAIGLAIHFGARQVILLGADCSVRDGLHWHGPHAGLRNCMSIKQWPRHFAAARKLADRRGARVINCSRKTTLTCFERGNLEDVLASLARPALIAA